MLSKIILESRQKHDDRNTKSGRGRPPARDGKRTYDRRSGTGRGREIKKGGGGGRNWGSDKNVAKNNEGSLKKDSTVNLETPLEEGDDTKAAEEEEVAATSEPVEDKKEEPEEDNTMSYEEYLKSKQGETTGILAPIQAKEVENEFQGKTNFVAKKDEEFLVMGSGKNLRKKGNKKDLEKKSIVPSFRVGEPAKRGGRDNRDRDRRGGRDRRGRGGGRGDRKEKKVEINTDDTEAFPTL